MLKLSHNGKSLATSQYLMYEAAKQLDLNQNRFPIFAALLRNHILPDKDLASFHWSLLGPEHPLASLKVWAQQLVLPPCNVVIKAVAMSATSRTPRTWMPQLKMFSSTRSLEQTTKLFDLREELDIIP